MHQFSVSVDGFNNKVILPRLLPEVRLQANYGSSYIPHSPNTDRNRTQMMWVRTYFSTRWTDESSFCSMHCFVPFQINLQRNKFLPWNAAPVTNAIECTCLKDNLVRKGFSTRFTLKWFLSSVNSGMHLKIELFWFFSLEHQ